MNSSFPKEQELIISSVIGSKFNEIINACKYYSEKSNA